MASRPRRKLVLVFGESDNDRSAIIEIARGIKPSTKVVFEKRTKPLVLLRSTERPETRRKSADTIASLVKAANVTDEVIAVIVHRDCDAVEPAHESVSAELESTLRQAGVPAPVAATPAFEMEAWWMLFPDALARVCGGWEPLSLASKSVGSINNAKEFLTAALRPRDHAKRNRVPDYCESDGIAVARNAREMGLITPDVRAKSGSLDHFWSKLEILPL